MFIHKVDQFFGKSKLSRILTFIFITLIIFFILVLPISLRPSPNLMSVGDVTFQDIRSPRAFSYTSELLTEQARQEAEKLVSPIYLPADPSISRKQVEKLRSLLQYIHIIRADGFSTIDQKIRDIQAITEVTLFSETANSLLNINDENWDNVQNEALFLLENLMKSSIRDDQVDSVRSNLSTQIGFDINESESEIIIELVSPLITANSLFNNDHTTQAIQEARDNVEPVLKKYQAGEIIISSGEVISPLAWEALRELGYTEPKNRLLDYLSAGIIVIVLVGFNLLYFWRIRQSTGHRIEGLSVIVILFIIFLISDRLFIPNHVILPYLFPVAGFGLIISSLYNYELGFILSVSLGLLSAYNQADMVNLALYYIIPTGMGIFILGQGRRIMFFFIAGLSIAISGSVLIIAIRILSSFLDLSGVVTLLGASFINGFGSISLALILQYIIAQILGKTTALQLMDLSRPDHPLLQELLLNAPGTYQHSLQVANLAEQAAKEINADALLTRVGALYHDIGKAKNPLFFIENQHPANMDTHENLDPQISSAAIVQHVDDGLEMAKKYRLPPQIKAFISEHHGTTLTNYQYEQAVERIISSEEIDTKLFRYHGPIPGSKETALVMLADGCEAIVRADPPENRDDIFHIVEKSVKSYLDLGQLDQTELTLNDLRLIVKSFSRTLQNAYHHRIKYPAQLKAENKSIS